MKSRLLYLMIVLAFFFSCEENKDGFYDNIARIYFPEETDSLSFSFGDKIAEYTRHVVNVPVKMMGMNATEEMRFKVVLNTELSTAEEGVHFVELQSEYPLLVDSVNAYIPVELIRDELSEDEVTYKIVLDLEANTDFNCFGFGSKYGFPIGQQRKFACSCYFQQLFGGTFMVDEYVFRLYSKLSSGNVPAFNCLLRRAFDR